MATHSSVLAWRIPGMGDSSLYNFQVHMNTCISQLKNKENFLDLMLLLILFSRVRLFATP